MTDGAAIRMDSQDFIAGESTRCVRPRRPEGLRK